MANVHGFGNNANRNPNRNNPNPGDNYQNLNAADQIPFLNPMRSDRPPMDETIPYTLKLICCPDFAPLSFTFLFLVLIWTMYIFCCTQGIDQSNFQVLQIQTQVLIDYGGALGSLIVQGQVYRLITASFLHASLMHILMNSITLLFICTRFEKIYPKSTPLVLLVSSITGFMLSVLCDRNVVTVGASTAIFGILGGFVAYLMINWTALERYGSVRSTLACIIGIIIFVSLLFSLGASIDAIAHVGGLLGGLLISLAVLPGLQQKSSILMYVGIGGVVGMNLITFLVFFLSD